MEGEIGKTSAMAGEHSVEVASRNAPDFLRNLERRGQAVACLGPRASTPVWDPLVESMDGAPNAWMPHLGHSTWLHEGDRYRVEYLEEGTPVPGAMRPTYFRRLTVTGQGREGVQAFVAAMLRADRSVEDPLALGRVRTWASSSRGEWMDKGFAPAQGLDDLFLPPKTVAELLARLEAFEGAGPRCAAAGRMHKLGLLLMGVPGSGKSSLVRALAREFRRELCVLTLGRRMDDEICEELVAGMAPNRILLVEDFDSLGFSRSAKRTSCKDGDMHNVTRSFFLNVLDGVLRPPPGTVICLTSNSCVGLDKALARPGRVDLILRFGDPQEPEILAALDRLAEPRAPEGAEAAQRSADFGQFCARLRRLKKGSVCMSGIVDHLFRHPRDFLEAFGEFELRCAGGEALSEDGPTSMYM